MMLSNLKETTMITSTNTLAALAIAGAIVSGFASTKASAGPAAGTHLSPAFQSRINITCFGCRLPRPYQPPYRHWHWDRHYSHDWFRYQPIGYVLPSGPAVSAGPSQVQAASQAQPQADARCLTKQYLPDGRAVFQDMCTHEEAVTESNAAPTPGPKK
jgi:hypothetical protein